MQVKIGPILQQSIQKQPIFTKKCLLHYQKCCLYKNKTCLEIHMVESRVHCNCTVHKESSHYDAHVLRFKRSYSLHKCYWTCVKMTCYLRADFRRLLRTTA